MTASHVPKWWKESVVYQVYPASFKDSNGDGVGDLPGIISKLDYIKSLGVDVIWVSPFYKSPQHDLGYDISDYQAVHEPYGTIEDVETLIAGCHSRGLKVLFDLVINHTSDEHQWFKQSRSSRDNPKRDWYIWRPAKYDENGKRQPPNNWKSVFEGSVWEWDEDTQEYYLHYFLKQQPDLNWENAETRMAIYKEAVLFWLDKGIDGFRIDTVIMYSKYTEFPDAPITVPQDEFQPAAQYLCDGPRIHEFLQEMNVETFSKYDCVTIGELSSFLAPSLSKWKSYVSASRQELDMCIQFDLMKLDHKRARFNRTPRKTNLPEFKEVTQSTQKLIDPSHDSWGVTYLENHDQARSVSRFASDAEEYRVASAKMLAMYLLTLSGTLILYQGQEIGMFNIPKDWDLDKEYLDIDTINDWKAIKNAAKTDPELLDEGFKALQLLARDHARTPMQWDASPFAGFTTAKSTWMRVHDSFSTINVTTQEKDNNSVLNFYRTLLKMRKAKKDVFVYGDFVLLDRDNKSIFSFLKVTGEKSAFVVLNFTNNKINFELPQKVSKLKLLLSTAEAVEDKILAAYEGRIYTEA